MTNNPYLCYNCIYLKHYDGNIIDCSRLPRRYNPKIKCNYFKEQWTGGKGDVE